MVGAGGEHQRDGGEPVSTYVDGGAILVAVVAASLGGLFLVRWVLPHKVVMPHHDVTAAIFAITGTIYAVLLAFAVVIVWQSFTDTQTTVTQEANAVADLDRISRGFPVVLRRQVHDDALTYAHVVIIREWPLMANGGSSPEANAALIELWHAYTDMHGLQQSSPLYGQSLSELNDITDDRRVRLLSSQSRVPTVMWAMLVLGGVVVVLFSFLFAVRSLWLHAVMTVMLSGMIALSLLLIYVLNGPFAGVVKVQPTALVSTVDNMEHVQQ